MRLGIDLDGVVADFNTGWTRLYNADFNATVSASDVVAWNSIPSLTHFEDMSGFWEWASGGKNRPSMFRYLPTFPDALPALDRLSRAGHHIVILTTKPSFAVHDTFAWLADQRLPTTEVHMLENKWTVPCDVYLDDSPFQVADLTTHRPDATVCRYVRPWNTPVKGAADVESWSDFEGVVGQLAT